MELKTGTFYCSDEIARILDCNIDPSSRDMETMQKIMESRGGQAWLSDFKRCLKEGGNWYNRLELTHNGSSRWVETQISANTSETGEVEMVMGTFGDLTSQMGTEHELISTQNLLKTILDFMPGPVYSKAPDGTYLFVNKQFLDAVNRKVDNPVGKTDYEIYHDDTAIKLRENDMEVMKARETQESVEHVPHPDGTLRTYESYKFPTFDQFGEVQTVTGISFDVTEKQKFKKELELERSRLIQASKMTALGEMAGGIAHEINNPLAIIRGYTVRLKSLFYGEADEKGQKALKITEDILRAVERTGTIIHGFRRFARDPSLESFKRVSVEKIVQDTVALCNARFAESQVLIRLDLQQGLEMECQEVHISQVLMNLLGNALDATLEEGRRPESSVVIKTLSHTEDGRDWIKLQVHDWGGGFSQEASERLTEPFYSTKTAEGGTGLGLSISKSLVEKHQGRLQLISAKGPTIVEMQIPVVQNPSGESQDAQ